MPLSSSAKTSKPDTTLPNPSFSHDGCCESKVEAEDATEEQPLNSNHNNYTLTCSPDEADSESTIVVEDSNPDYKDDEDNGSSDSDRTLSATATTTLNDNGATRLEPAPRSQPIAIPPRKPAAVVVQEGYGTPIGVWSPQNRSR